jgi:hypothetical protein
MANGIRWASRSGHNQSAVPSVSHDRAAPRVKVSRTPTAPGSRTNEVSGRVTSTRTITASRSG